jgi:hypothetical protein
MFCIAMVRSKLEYSSVDLKPVTITDSNKIEGRKRKFAGRVQISRITLMVYWKN